MTDEQVAELLKSDHPLVVIEAPAGCGKTYQAAEFATRAAADIGNKRILTLTHTHAACSVIADRSSAIRQQITIRTLDGFIHEIASAYRIALGLPEDIPAWVRSTAGSHEQLAKLVSDFVVGNPMVANALARMYPKIICDEHQDSSADQERLVLAVGKAGSSVRIFGDPMQVIPGGQGQNQRVLEVQQRWEALKEQSSYGQLETPHRWKDTNPALGAWVLQARARLRDGHAIELNAAVDGYPAVQFAENASMGMQTYRLAPRDNNWWAINGVVNQDTPMLCLAGRSTTVYGLRSSFKERLPIWEGHTRNDLNRFIVEISSNNKQLHEKAALFVAFLQTVLTGFDARFADRFLGELQEPSVNPGGIIPPQMAAMAVIVRDEPSVHKGFAEAACHLRGLIDGGAEPFRRIRIDRPRELSDLIATGRFESADEGLAEIMQRRSRAHPKPPRKCLSTVHKSKGLEAHTVVIFGCDADHFPDQAAKRNLLYVALSRATHQLIVVRSENNPSPLIV